MINNISLESLLNNNEIETINSNDGLDYIFFRLYNSFYKPVQLVVRAPLKIAINTLIKAGKETGIHYTHAAINYTLNDNFIGLSNDGEYKVKHEEIDNPKPENSTFIKNVFPSQSIYTVIAIPVTAEEYNKIKLNLTIAINDKNIKYNTLYLFSILKAHLTNNKVISSEDTNIWKNLTTENKSIFSNEHEFVCSTFVAYILLKCSKRFETFFKKRDILTKYFTPSDLTRLPTAKLLYTGKWSNYKDDTRKYIARNGKFSKYL